MKHIRVLLLVAVIIALLGATLIPALAAVDPFDFYNMSFERDTNNDGVPDRWMMHGDNVIYVCGKPSGWMLDDCLVGFLPDDDRAIIYQLIDKHHVKPIEEGIPIWLFTMYAAAQNLEEGRVYGGIRHYWEGGESVTVYAAVPGGTYNFTDIVLKDSAGWAEAELGPSDYAHWGWLALPGDGQLFIDMASPIFG